MTPLAMTNIGTGNVIVFGSGGFIVVCEHGRGLQASIVTVY